MTLEYIAQNYSILFTFKCLEHMFLHDILYVDDIACIKW